MAEQIDFDDLNKMSPSEFVAALSGIFERSSWVPERVLGHRPFTSIRSLHQAMTGEVSLASAREQQALLDAYPDMVETAAGSPENDPLDDDERDRFDEVHKAYRSRFGLPFIIAGGMDHERTVLTAMEKRVAHDVDEEQREALSQISEIARLRLEALLHHDSRENEREDAAGQPF